MKKIAIITFFVIICCIRNILSQDQNLIEGTIRDGDNNPLANVSVRISNRASQVSDSNGEFKFVLPLRKVPGSKVEFVVSVNQDALVIFEPTRGIWSVPIDPLEDVNIVLLPKGDHRLLSKDGLKLLIKEIVDQETEKKTRELLQLQIEKGLLEHKLLTSSEADPLKVEAERLGFTKAELITALENVKEQLQKSDDPYEVGLSALYDKHFRKASELIRQSIEADELIIDQISEILPDKYLRLGDSQLGDNNLEDAEASYRKIIELQPDNFRGYFNVAKILYIRGDLRGALENLQSSLKYYKNTDDLLLLAHIRNNLGFLYLSVDIDVVSAISNFMQARDIYKSNNQVFELLATYNNLIFAYNKIENYKEAVKIGNEGLKLYDKKFRFTITLLFEYELSKKIISDSLVEKFSQRDIQLSLNSDFYMAPDGQRWMIFDKNNNKKYFIKKTENALVVCQYPELYAQLNNNIGIAYNFLFRIENKKEYFDAVINAYNDALEIRQKAWFPIEYANQIFNLGWAFEHFNNANEKENLLEAVKLYNEALLVYKEINFTEKIMNLEKRIETVQEKISNIE